MAYETGNPQPPDDLVAEGNQWANTCFLEEGHATIKAFLHTAYKCSLTIFRHHQLDMVQRITECGGVDRVSYVNFNGGFNALYCKDGTVLPLSHMLYRTVSQNPVENSGVGTQTYQIAICFAGREIDADHDEGDRIDLRQLTAHSPIHQVFDPAYEPSSIYLQDSVITRFQEQAHPLSSYYGVDIFEWYPHLRAEFRSNPLSDNYEPDKEPELKVTNIPFSATIRSERSPHGFLTRIFDSEGILHRDLDPMVAADKLKRYQELLRHAYQQVVGRAAPAALTSLTAARQLSS